MSVVPTNIDFNDVAKQVIEAVALPDDLQSSLAKIIPGYLKVRSRETTSMTDTRSYDFLDGFAEKVKQLHQLHVSTSNLRAQIHKALDR